METLFIGRNCIKLDEVDSTNTYANKLLKEVCVPDGSLIITEKQTQGRGQRGNEWLSEQQANITASLIICPNFIDIKDHFLLSETIAIAIKVALLRFLNSDNCSVKIKWPNDILVNNKKICGILIENSIQDSKIKNSIIGFGINVNQMDFHQYAATATSIRLLTGKKIEKEELLNEICKQFETRYFKLKALKYNNIRAEYLSYLLGFNEFFEFEEISSKQLHKGKIIDVKNNGEVLVESENMELKNYSFKEIKFL